MAGTTAVVAAAPATPVARPSAVTIRVPDAKDMPTDEQLSTRVSQFLDAAYAGWSLARVAGSGQWKLPDGTSGFSEDIGVGLLAESIQRGTWQKSLPVWTDALAAQQNAGTGLAFTTSTYAGGVRDYAHALQTRAAVQIEALRPLLAASDLKVLATPHFMTLVADHGDSDLLQAAQSFITTRSSRGLDVATAVRLFEALVDSEAIFGSTDAVSKALNDVVDKSILPSLRSADGGVFLDSGSGLVDVKSGIEAGALLLSAGGSLSDTRLSAYGRGLLVSCLAIADDTGVLPATVSLASGKVTRRDGALQADPL